MTKPKETVEGTIDTIKFHNEENGYSILSLKANKVAKEVTVVGNMYAPSVGSYIRCSGLWGHHPKFGDQFKASKIEIAQPKDIRGMFQYLSSGRIPGIGEKRAQLILEKWGESAFEVLNENPGKIKEIEGVGKKTADAFVEAWTQEHGDREVLLFLHECGLGPGRITRILKEYGKASAHKIKENPYRLISDIPGISFNIADSIAMKVGVALDSPERIRHALSFVLSGSLSEGNTMMRYSDLVRSTLDLLKLHDQKLIKEAVKEAIEKKELVGDFVNDKPYVYLRHIHKDELAIISHIKRLMPLGSKTKTYSWGITNVEEKIKEHEYKNGKTLSQEQKEAVKAVLTHKVVLITGGPGVGKTTVAKTFLDILKKVARIELAAPTGKAAIRLSESTDRSASTIHRLLGVGETGGFERTKDNPIDADLILIDESSMVDLPLMASLLEAISSTTSLIIMGDPNQLPSVGPGAILRDFLKSKQFKTIKLTKIFRQAEGSFIVENAYRILRGSTSLMIGEDFEFIQIDESNGETPLFELIKNEVVAQHLEKLPSRGFSRKDIQILTPMRFGDSGIISLNAQIQEELFKDTDRKVVKISNIAIGKGDKIIQTKNNYESSVFNGEIGIVLDVDPNERIIQAEFPDIEGHKYVEYSGETLSDINLAYALTIHRSQGSEYPALILPVTTQHYKMLERQLLYTAVTRAKQHITIVGQTKALLKAIQEYRANQRTTAIAERLIKEFAA